MKKTVKKVRAPRQGNEELYQLGCQTVVLMTTDSQEFAEFGIDQARIAGLQNLCDSFNQRKVDEAYVLLQKLKTFEKQQAAQELLRELYKLEAQVNFQWADLGIGFSPFKLGSISNSSDLELLSKAKTSIKSLSEQTEIWVNTDLLDAVAQKADWFEEAIEAQKNAARERSVGAKLRQAQAASFYAQIRKYRALGKKIWFIKGEYARSKAYLMPSHRKKRSAASIVRQVSQITEEEIYDYSGNTVESNSLVS